MKYCDDCGSVLPNDALDKICASCFFESKYNTRFDSKQSKSNHLLQSDERKWNTERKRQWLNLYKESEKRLLAKYGSGRYNK